MRSPYAFPCESALPPHGSRLARLGLLLLMAVLIVAPGSASSADDVAPSNPPAPGFDAEASDAAAIAAADRTMEAMGGRDAWDATRYLTWNFFGRRVHLWDKHEGLSRIELTDEDGKERVLLLDLGTKEGSVWVDGEEVTDPGERAQWLDNAEAMWINDSYWLFMPYKLKDTGVTLRHLGKGELAGGGAATVLELTFEAVGRTPQNKYHVFIADDSGLVEQWSFFREAGQEEPDFTTPWNGWQPYGRILLSGDRGERQITDIAVLETIEAGAFERP